VSTVYSPEEPFVADNAPGNTTLRLVMKEGAAPSAPGGNGS
jgi:hypothetical protein